MERCWGRREELQRGRQLWGISHPTDSRSLITHLSSLSSHLKIVVTNQLGNQSFFIHPNQNF